MVKNDNTKTYELEQIEEALGKSGERYHNLIEMSPDAILLTDPIGNFLMVNRQAAMLHGFESPEEMLSSGKNAFDLIAPEDGERAIGNLKKTIELGSIRNAEYTLLSKDGTELPAELSASVFTDAKGEPQGFIGVVRDISEHKRVEGYLKKAYEEMKTRVRERAAEVSAANKELQRVIAECELAQAALKESEELFRIVTEGGLAGVYIIQEGKFRYVNPALSFTFGYTPDELIDKVGPLELTHPEDHSMVTEQLRRRLSGELEAVRYTVRGLKKDGSIIYCEVLSRRLEYKGNQAAVGTLIDITEQKKTEEEMKRRLMKFSLKEGSLYLVEEPFSVMSYEAFKDLLDVGYRGLVISRTPEEEFRNTLDGEFDFSWLSEKGEKAQSPNLSEIYKVVESLPGKITILVERLDYLVFKNGFKETLDFVQRLRDLAYLASHIVILSLDPSTLGKRELRVIKKEAKEIETFHREALPNDLLEALRFINRQNALGIRPSYTDIGKNLKISKPTVQKRIKLLNSGGFITEITRGRRKVVELADTGRILLLK